MVYPGSLALPTAWAYLPDLANAFGRVANKALTTPERFAPFEQFHFKGYSLTGADLAEQLADVAWEQGWLQAGGELKIGSLPWPLLKAGGWLVPMWRELAEMHYLWRTPHALAGDKLAALIGPEPHTELSVALQQSLQELGKMGRLVCDAPLWA